MKYLLVILLFCATISISNAQTSRFTQNGCTLEVVQAPGLIKYSFNLADLTWSRQSSRFLVLVDGISGMTVRDDRIVGYPAATSITSLISDLASWKAACAVSITVSSDTLFIGSDTIVTGVNIASADLIADGTHTTDFGANRLNIIGDSLMYGDTLSTSYISLGAGTDSTNRTIVRIGKFEDATVPFGQQGLVGAQFSIYNEGNTGSNAQMVLNNTTSTATAGDTAVASIINIGQDAGAVFITNYGVTEDAITTITSGSFDSTKTSEIMIHNNIAFTPTASRGIFLDWDEGSGDPLFKHSVGIVDSIVADNIGNTARWQLRFPDKQIQDGEIVVGIGDGKVDYVEPTLVDTLTDQTTVTWDATAIDVATLTLRGNRTLSVPTGMTDGQTLVLKVIQGSPGSFTLDTSAFHWSGGGIDPVITATNAAVDIITFIKIGANVHGSILQDFQ